VWLVLMLAGLLSAAIGFDMARYIAQRQKGSWFRQRIRAGAETWWMAVMPAVSVAMLLLAATFALIVAVSGDPRIW
jgi:ABC-type phosphate transport system permease subunit